MEFLINDTQAMFGAIMMIVVIARCVLNGLEISKSKQVAQECSPHAGGLK